VDVVLVPLLAVLFALAFTAPAGAHHCKPGTGCTELKRTYKPCKRLDPRYPRQAKCNISRAARHYGQSVDFMRYLAHCESRYRWWAYNPSGASGLFQFMRSTYATTPYSRRSLWSPKWNALAAGWMLAQGRRGEWAC
jgi:soluble lytic murein transglycosylase-like protein